MKVGILISDGMESPDNLSKHKIPASLRTDLISIDTDLLFFNLNRALTINFLGGKCLSALEHWTKGNLVYQLKFVRTLSSTVIRISSDGVHNSVIGPSAVHSADNG